MLGSEVTQLPRVLETLHISLTRQQLQMDPAPLLRLVMQQFFEGHDGLVDALLQFPDPISAAPEKVRRFWRGEGTSEAAEAMCRCDPAGPLVINVVKMLRTPDATDFLALGRVLSGTVRAGEEVDVCGEA